MHPIDNLQKREDRESSMRGFIFEIHSKNWLLYNMKVSPRLLLFERRPTDSLKHEKL